MKNIIRFDEDEFYEDLKKTENNIERLNKLLRK